MSGATLFRNETFWSVLTLPVDITWGEELLRIMKLVKTSPWPPPRSSESKPCEGWRKLFWTSTLVGEPDAPKTVKRMSNASQFTVRNITKLAPWFTYQPAVVKLSTSTCEPVITSPANETAPAGWNTTSGPASFDGSGVTTCAGYDPAATETTAPGNAT